MAKQSATSRVLSRTSTKFSNNSDARQNEKLLQKAQSNTVQFLKFNLANSSSMAFYLDPINQAFADKLTSSTSPRLNQLSYGEARQALEKLQEHEAAADVTREVIAATGGPSDTTVNTVLFKPKDAAGIVPLAFYFHGGGWILASPSTHDSIVSDLVRQTGFAFAFPDYSHAPEAQFPRQFEECYAAVEHFVNNGARYGLRTEKIAFVGDSAGSQMCTAMSTLASQRNLPAKIAQQILFYPVTDCHTKYESYETYGNNPHLDRRIMSWMHTAFLPNADDRLSILASPALMTLERAAKQPPTLIIIADVDILKDEGRKFGRLLQQAGVEAVVVDVDGVLHDFVVLEGIRSSPAAKMSVELAAMKIKRALEK